ncbi:hypothetical protein, variant [Saprolegnia diclina VS20]|uniref:RecF/RecN/SMC N-terminal domain-containing protein n=1 Tax=Saprolegnia diclina (strain VS20) TaxID=1156394 RepID=T0RNJ8_SAPDV|nr:hypothetical protein, variant [Saprolegnia diclina VS20]EQC31577.1 hypothetical protein, variant [Saprolegnia diclina VS20]|eukprot:XP_008614976.1 hypothetical protein, variant [Saprolegnia diclina VS20]
MLHDVGKSNLLEAICFAMGSSVLATFRVKQWKDLLNCAEKEASIKLTLTTASQGEASVGVTLAPSGHRVYYVNNRAKAKKELKRFLRASCGINMDVSLWLIQQNLVHKMALKKEDELASYLCEAAGTKYFLECRQDASLAIAKFKPTLAAIQSSIAHLEATLQHQTAAFTRKVDLQKLTHAIALQEASLQRLQTEKRQALEAEAARALATITDHIETCQAALDDLHGQQHAMQDELTRLVKKTPPKSLDVIENAMERCSSTIEEVKYVLAAATAQETTLQTQLEAMRQDHDVARLERDASRDSMDTQEQIIAKLTFERRALAWYSKLVKDAQPWTAPDTTSCIRKSLEAKMADASDVPLASGSANRLAENGVAMETMRAELAQLETEMDDLRQKAAHADRAALKRAPTSTIPNDMDRLRRELQQQQQTYADHEMRHFPGLHAQPPRQGSGDYGALVSLFRLQPHLSAWWPALGLVLDGQLLHRVCDTAETAKSILNAHHRRCGLLIWPLAQLQVRPRAWDSKWSQLQREFGDRILDPLQLFSSDYDCALELWPCYRRALGAWLFVDSDATAKHILQRFGIPCVTKTLNMHSSGVLTGGSSPAQARSTGLLNAVQLHALSDRVSLLRRREAELLQRHDDHEQAMRHRDEHARIQNTIQQLEHEKSLVQARCAQLDEEHIELKRDAKAAVHHQLQRRVFVDLGTSRTAFCKTTTPDWHQELARVLASLQAKNDQLHALEHERRFQQAKLRAAGERCETLAEEVADLEQALHDAKSYVLQHQDKLGTLEQERADLEVQLGAAKSQHEVYRTLLQDKRQLDMRVALEEEELLQWNEKKAALVATSLPRQRPSSRLQGTSTTARSSAEILAEMEATETELQQLQARSTRLVNDRSLEHQHVNAEVIARKQHKLVECRDHAASIDVSIANLETGISVTSDLSAKVQEIAFASVGATFEAIFSRLVPLKSATLQATRAEALECGLYFSVNGSRQTTRELSGGQLTLLGLAYVFALAHYSASPLYILDEIDAALDEHNQLVVADLIWAHFGQSQVFCISHHESVHAKATTLLKVRKDAASTYVEVVRK